MTAPIGHNGPPDAFAAHEANILDLMELAESALLYSGRYFRPTEV